MFDLKGRAALITGSTRGIGAAVAEAFAAAGADVVIHGRHRGEQAELVLERCLHHGVVADCITVDLSGPPTEVVEQLHAEAIAAQSGIDILVHCAGGHQGEGHFLDVDGDLFERTMRLHVTVPFFLTQRFARRWIDAGRDGRVLMIGSVNGILAEPGSSAYDTSKGALAMMVKTLAVELAPLGVRVNGVAPGLVVTDRTRWVEDNPQLGEWMRLHTPNGLVPRPDACTPAALMLVSDEAYHIHGQMLMVDGGMSVWQQPGLPRGE